MAEIDIERKQTTAWPWILLGLVVLALLAWWLLGHRSTDARAAAVTPAAQVMDTTYNAAAAGVAAMPAADSGVIAPAASTANTANTANTAVPTANVPAARVATAPTNVAAADIPRVNGAVVNAQLARGVTSNSAVQAFLKFDQDHRALAGADTTHEYTADGLRRLAVALGAINEQDAAHRGTLQPRLSALLTRANELEKNPESTRHSEYTRAAFMDAASVMGMLQQQRFPTLQTNVTQVKQAAAAVQPNTLLLQQKATVQKFYDSAADAVRAMTP